MNALMTPTQVCQKLNLKLSYLYWLTHKKEIPFIKIGNHIRFDEADIVNWLEQRKRNGGEANEYI
jgi:excisionase family DNA binding protein